MNLRTKQILTTLIAAGLSLYTSPRGISHEDGNDDDHERGGHVEGHERIEQKTRLTVTADAPVGSKGHAELRARNLNGVTAAILKLEVEGLPVGNYNVTVTSLADPTVTTLLGNFDVVAASTDPSGDGDDDTGEDRQPPANPAGAASGDAEKHDGEHHDGQGDDGESSVVFGGLNGAPLPDGFNPLDIGGITVANANDVALLTGSFATAPTSAFTAVVQVQGGVDAPTASGRAVVRARVKRNVLTQRFVLAMHDLPANTPVTVTFNGVQSIRARTSGKGILGVTRLPRGVAGHRLTSVAIDGLQGEHLGTAHF